MIRHLRGTILTSDLDHIVLEVNSIGYKINTSAFSDLKNGDNLSLHIYHHVSSDYQPQLFGFQDVGALKLFERLLKISGIGPKIALKIIEHDTSEALETAILEGDINYFTRVKGLGKKGAQKIILELKNELVDITPDSESDFIYEALTSLKFTKREIDRAMQKVSVKGMAPETAIAALLKEMGNHG